MHFTKVRDRLTTLSCMTMKEKSEDLKGENVAHQGQGTDPIPKAGIGSLARVLLIGMDIAPNLVIVRSVEDDDLIKKSKMNWT